MIIIISGTNGSGKTHLMRRLIERIKGPSEEIRFTRSDSKVVSIGTAWEKTTVLGRYDTACGGCDKFSWGGAGDDLEKLITAAVAKGHDVLLEGLMVSAWGIERLSRLRDLGLQVVHLTTPVQQCIDSVNDRRRARAEREGKEYTPVNTTNLVSKHGSLQKQNANRRRAGITVHELDREAAFIHVVQQLGL